MSMSPLSLFDRILFFLGSPKTTQGACWKCHRSGMVLDLGDGDLMCQSCWDAHVPKLTD